MAEDLAELVEIGDLDELLRATDRLCDAREWAALVELRDRCRKAVERGKQLWPAANHMEYRLALEAPGEFAARMLTDVAGSSVSAHWRRSRRRVTSGPSSRRMYRARRRRSMCAHERVRPRRGPPRGRRRRSRSARAAAPALRRGNRLRRRRVPVPRRRLSVAGPELGGATIEVDRRRSSGRPHGGGADAARSRAPAGRLTATPPRSR